MSTSKPNLTRVWAAGAAPGNVVDPDTSAPGKFDDGWLAEVPTFQHFNFLQQLFTQGLAHNNEQGINVWDTATLYPIGGLAKGSNSIVYEAVTSNMNIDPTSDDGTNWKISFSSNNTINTSNVASMDFLPLTVGQIVFTKGYYADNDGGQAKYLIVPAESADEFGDHTLPNGNVAKLLVDGWVNAKQFGLKGDTVTDDSAAEVALMASSNLFIFFPTGVYQTNLSNGTSNRTFLFADGAIIDGVIHITGTGPATLPPQGSVTWVDNVRMLGTATATVRFGTFYTRKLNVDKIRIAEVNPAYVNQTLTGGSTGVHLYFGTKEMECGEIICDSGALNYNFSVDQGPVKGVDEVPENIHIGRLVINQTDVTGLVTAETINLRIDEIVQKNQGGANVAWISSNDKKLKVGKITHDGTGADSGQVGIYLQNTDSDSSAEFGTVDISNVPGIAFRTFNTGKVHIGTLIGNNNREHARIQSHVTIVNVEGDASLEVGINFFDNFAAGSSIGRCELTGTDGTGINVGSDDITIPYAKCDGFATLYGLLIPAGTENFNNDYYEGANCSQALRCLSAGPINMGVLNLHDNTNGIIGSGMSDFGFDYAINTNNTTDTNVVLEVLPGFRGKKVRQSVSADRGDASVTLTIGVDQISQRFATTLTANRTVTLSTTNAVNGDKFRISRTGAGAFNLSTSGTFNNKGLAQDEWVEYEFQGAGWYLTAKGSLV